jgi:hypothetical protein
MGIQEPVSLFNNKVIINSFTYGVIALLACLALCCETVLHRLFQFSFWVLGGISFIYGICCYHSSNKLTSANMLALVKFVGIFCILQVSFYVITICCFTGVAYVAGGPCHAVWQYSNYRCLFWLIVPLYAFYLCDLVEKKRTPYLIHHVVTHFPSFPWFMPYNLMRYSEAQARVFILTTFVVASIILFIKCMYRINNLELSWHTYVFLFSVIILLFLAKLQQLLDYLIRLRCSFGFYCYLLCLLCLGGLSIIGSGLINIANTNKLLITQFTKQYQTVIMHLIQQDGQLLTLEKSGYLYLCWLYFCLPFFASYITPYIAKLPRSPVIFISFICALVGQIVGCNCHISMLGQAPWRVDGEMLLILLAFLWLAGKHARCRYSLLMGPVATLQHGGARGVLVRQMQLFWYMVVNLLFAFFCFGWHVAIAFWGCFALPVSCLCLYIFPSFLKNILTKICTNGKKLLVFK